MRRLIQKLKTVYSFGILVGYIFFVMMPLGWYYSLMGGRDQEKNRRSLQRRISAFLRYYTFHCVCGAEAELRNPYAEDFTRPALIIANHQSLLDLPSVLMLGDKKVCMTGQWVWDSKIYGRVVRLAGFFPASMPMEEMMNHLSKAMEQGYSVVVFPEGTRSEDCSIQKFRRGAFHIAEQLKCDIVPVTLWGTGRVLPKLDFCLQPGRMIIDVGKRIRYADGVMGEGHGPMTRYWHKYFLERYAAIEAEQLALPASANC